MSTMEKLSTLKLPDNSEYFIQDDSAIASISRSGNTFTATKRDGSSFTFTQRDITVSSSSEYPNLITITDNDGNSYPVNIILSDATQSAHGLMSASDKTKLDGVATGAEVNQFAFSTIIITNIVDQDPDTDSDSPANQAIEVSTNLNADSKTDSFQIVAGDNVTLVPVEVADKVTINAKDTVYTLTQSQQDGHTFTLEDNDNHSTTITIPDNNTTYTISVDNTNGTLTLTPSEGQPVTVTIPFAGTANRAVADESGNNIKATYGASLSHSDASNSDINLVNKNGTVISTVSIANASQSEEGLMSASDKTKLDGVATGAQVNVVETVKVNGTALTPDANKAVNVTVPTKTSDITNDSNYPSDANYVHTDNNYTTTEKNKLSGIAEGAEVNQNAFSRVTIGSTNIDADSKTDALTIIAGDNITLTPNATNDSVTIKSSYVNTTYTLTQDGTDPRILTFTGSDGSSTSITTAGKTYTLTVGTGDDVDKIILTSSTGDTYKITVPYATHADHVDKNLTIQLNGGTTEGTNKFTFNGSAAKSINLTKSSVGLGNVDNTADADKSVSHASTADSATTATKATQDESGNNIKASYGASLSHDSTNSNNRIDLVNKSGTSISNVTIADATTTQPGLLSTSDKTKLNGIATGAEVNQNAFSNVKVGSTTIAADAKTDTLELVAGDNVTLTPDASGDKITISSKDTTYTPASAAPGKVATNSSVGTSTNYARQDHTHGIDVTTGDSNGQVKIAGQNVSVKGLGSAAYKDIVDTYSPTGTDPVSGKAIKAALDTLPEPMVFKGTVGASADAPTVTSLPVDGSANIGWTYKVVTNGTYAGMASKVGDTFVCLTKTSTANTWVLIPSGDEPSGTVTSVGLQNATNGGLTISGSPITSSGTITVGHTNVVTAGTAKGDDSKTLTFGGTFTIPSVTYDANGHVTAKGTTTMTMPANPNTDTKVTSSANHYTPATASGSDKSASASGATAAWSIDVVKGVTLNTDGKGHVTGISVTSGKIPPNPNTDRYVNSASFTDDSTNTAASPIKMTLTRAGSDSVSVTANIPKVSSSSAGVAPKGAAVSSQSQTTKFLREDGTWAAPSYTTNTNTTYTFENGTNCFYVTPSGGTKQTVTVTPSITNNITGSGTSGYIAKFNGTNTITNGPAFGTSTTTWLNNKGEWTTPPNDNTTYTIATGDSNGQIKVTPSSGSAYNVDVKGLGSNAYTSTAYLPLAGGTMTGALHVSNTGKLIWDYASGQEGAFFVINNSENYGIRYKEGNPDTMKFSASGNANTDAGADLCINGNGDGTVTIRGNTIAHAGNVGTGDANGQVKIAGTNVSVKGLGSNAYTSTAYLPLAGGTLTGRVAYNNVSMPLSAGKVTSLAAGTTEIFKDGIAISNPATSNDVGWIRVTGTGESDTVLEIATGDDGGGSTAEKIVVREYNTSNAVAREAVLLNTDGTSSFPVSVTAPKFIGALQGNADTATSASAVPWTGVTNRPTKLSQFTNDITFATSIATSTGTNQLTLAHGGKYAITAGGTSFVFTMPTDNNTDVNVSQTATNTNANYEVLFSGTADNTTRTEGARKYSNLLFNPSTGTLTTTKVSSTEIVCATIDADTGNITDANVGNLIVTGAARFLNTINGSVSGTASNVTGIVAIANGGTGASTAANARANLGTPYMYTDSYPTLMQANGTNSWIKIGTSNSDYGLLPSTSGGAGSGHNYIGTSSWYWKYAYIDQIYGYLNGNISGSSTSCSGNAATATTATKATKANLTTTQYGIAFYSATDGTFGNNPCLITTSTGGLEVKGMIAGDSGSTGHGLYGGGGYHNAYNNILLHGDASTGSSGIAFVSDKITASTGAVTNVNQPSDRAFIQYHACGITTATAEGTNPTLATSGESGKLVIGIGNDSDDCIWLQTPARLGLIHQIGGTSSCVIPDTGNTSGNVGSATQPVYVNAGCITATTYSLAKSVPSNAVFTDANVTQTATTTNANYEVLFSVTADNTTRTEGARKNSNLIFNPSTGTLTTTNIAVGTLTADTGNITSATLGSLVVNGNASFVNTISSNYLVIQGLTSATNTYADTNPKIYFKDNDGSQNISLTYTDYDSVQNPSSLTLNGNQGNEYFIAPNIKATGSFYGNLSGNASTATSATTASYANAINLVATNEIRIGNKPSSAQDVYIGYKWADNTSAALINKYIFCNGTGGTYAPVQASKFIGALQGNADTATSATSATTATWATLLKPIATQTTAAASTWNIPSGCYQVWGECFKDSRLTYTPSGGSATVVTDTGDWTMWLAGTGTTNVATFNMRIDGNYYGTTFVGALSGNATTATTATNTNYLIANSRMDYGWNGVNYFNHSANAGNGVKVNDNPTSAWWHIMRFNHANNSGYYTDLAVPFNDTSLYYKRIAGGALQNGGWVQVSDALNVGYTYTTTVKYYTHTRKFQVSKSTSAWDAQAYSQSGYVDNVFVTFKPNQTNMAMMVGLNTDPTTNADYSSIDYALYCMNSGKVSIYESGTERSVGAPTYAAGDEFRVEYSGGYVRYYQNGTLLREVARSISGKLYFDTSFHGASSCIYDVSYGPCARNAQYAVSAGTASSASAVAWGNVTGKPDTYAPSAHNHGTLHSDFTIALANTTEDSGWSMINPTYNGYLLKSIRFQGSSPAWGVGNYGAGICFGGSDTKGIISCAYSSPLVKIAGGNGTKPVWWIGLTGTSGTSYNLASFLTAHQTVTDNNPTLAWSTKSKVATIGSTEINVTMPANPNTWRGIQDNLTSSTNTTESLSAKQGYLLANGSARDSTKVAKAGDTMTGHLCISDKSGSYSWNEGIRINKAGNNYSSLVMGGAVDSTSGTADGVWWMGCNMTTLGRKLYFAHNGSTASSTYFYADSSSQVSPHLRIGGTLGIGNVAATKTCKISYNDSLDCLDFTFVA